MYKKFINYFLFLFTPFAFTYQNNRDKSYQLDIQKNNLHLVENFL